MKNNAKILRVCEGRISENLGDSYHSLVCVSNLWRNIEIDCVCCLAEINQNVAQRFRWNDVYRILCHLFCNTFCAVICWRELREILDGIPAKFSSSLPEWVKRVDFIACIASAFIRSRATALEKE